MNEVILTEDGSNTILSKTFHATYHSLHGAIEETSVVFIQAGLNEISKKKKTLDVLEIGFGTGLNAYMTLIYCQKTEVKVRYTTLEPFPIAANEYLNLNYPSLLGQTDTLPFLHLHKASFGVSVEISDFFNLNKLKFKVQEYLTDHSFDLIYYDAFAPNCQPELWTKEVFSKMFGLLRPGGMLVTYCAKGEVKRNLKSVGFTIETLPGPGRKREISRAIKQAKELIS